MFKKKNCKKCNKTIKKSYDFCPYCGKPLDENNSWGMLGRNDFSEKIEQPQPLFGGGLLNNLIGNAMKIMEKEMQKGMKNIKPSQPKAKLQLFINGKKVNVGPPNQMQPPRKEKVERKRIPAKTFSKENSKKFSNLTKEEPVTHVRRLSDRIVYEIEMKDVKSISDISIVQLENSIEIKAIGKEKSYYKLIQISLPIVDYYFSEDKLILELDSKN